LDEIFRVVTRVLDLDALHVVRRGVVIGMNKWITEPQWKSSYKHADDEKEYSYLQYPHQSQKHWLLPRE
jgi:hypothetical protein